VDPVAGTGKVTAQARAWRWPAVLAAEEACVPGRLTGLWEWCLSWQGREAATAACAQAGRAASDQIAAVVADLLAQLPPGTGQAR
jgi:hypothetical protein